MTTDITKEIKFNRDTKDFDCYVTIDGRREYIGSAPTNRAGEIKCNAYAISYYEDAHTPEKAAALALANRFALAEQPVACCMPDDPCSPHDPCPLHVEEARAYLATQTRCERY